MPNDAEPTLLGGAAEAGATESPNAGVDVATTAAENRESNQTETPAESPKDEKQAGANVVPEKYEFTAPDGKEYDADTIGLYSEAAREAGLSQHQADVILSKIAPHLEARQMEAVNQMAEQWSEASRTDKEFGGEKLNENLGIANKALKQFASPELISFLEESRLGNHPEMIRMLFKVGKAISQDGFVGGSSIGGKSVDPQQFYSKSNMNP